MHAHVHTRTHTHIQYVHLYSQAHIHMNSNSPSVNYISPTMSASSPQPYTSSTLSRVDTWRYTSNQLSLIPLEKKRKSDWKSGMRHILQANTYSSLSTTILCVCCRGKIMKHFQTYSSNQKDRDAL